MPERLPSDAGQTPHHGRRRSWPWSTSAEALHKRPFACSSGNLSLGPRGVAAAHEAHSEIASPGHGRWRWLGSIPQQRGSFISGVGNIIGADRKAGHGRTQSMVSHNGTVGQQQFSKMAVKFSLLLEEGSLVVLHSDGLGVELAS